MKKPNLHRVALFIISASLLVLPAARAQQPAVNGSQPSDASQPIAPLASSAATGSSGNATSLAASASGDQASTQVQPDTHILSGAEMLGLGFLRAPHSFFDPVVRITLGADTGLVQGTTEDSGSIGGGFALDEQWGRFHLITQYYGAKLFYYPASSFSSSYHDLSFSPTLTFGRWVVHLRDDLRVSPEQSFGGLDIAGAPLPASDAALTSVTPLLEPPETIATGWAERLDNTALAEVDYSLSRRSTVTFSGSYGLLHFFQSGYIDGATAQGHAGYTYRLTPRDSMAVTYNYSLMSFTGTTTRTVSHLAQLSFSHTLAARWSFQVAGGPELLQFQGLGLPSGSQLTWSLTSSLNYLTHHNAYALQYFRGITGGSGVILGAETEGLTASVSRSLTRYWSGALNGGAAQNTGLVPSQALPQFDYWFAGGNIGRPLGRHLHFNLNYAYQRQTQSGGCAVLSCGLSTGRNAGSFTLEWHPLGVHRE
jgi:hypothetical protein